MGVKTVEFEIELPMVVTVKGAFDPGYPTQFHEQSMSYIPGEPEEVTAEVYLHFSQGSRKFTVTDATNIFARLSKQEQAKLLEEVRKLVLDEGP